MAIGLSYQATTLVWAIVLLLSGLLDGLINIWAYQHSQEVASLWSVKFVVFVGLATLIYMASIGLFLASMVAAPARPGFAFIWPMSVVFFSAIILTARGEIHLSHTQWTVGLGLTIAAMVFWTSQGA